MSPVVEILEKTERLIHVLMSEEDRDEKIKIVHQLLVERQQIIELLKLPFSSEERAIGQKIDELNKKLTELLSNELISIQQDIKSLNQKKETSAKYTNPYELLTTDGVFYDKRK